MTITVERKMVLHCKCVHCGWEWDAFEKPKRCASCKRYTWNKEDLRTLNPGRLPTERREELREKLTPKIPDRLPRSPLSPGSVKQLLHTLKSAQTIIGEIIEQNPCGHGEGKCDCDDKRTLAEIDATIVQLSTLVKKPRRNTSQIPPTMRRGK